MPARADVMGLNRQRTGGMVGRHNGFQEINMPIQPVLNFVPLKQQLGLTTETKKVAGLSAPMGAVAGLSAAAPKPRADRPHFGPVGEEQASELCPHCGLALGDLAYAASRDGGPLMHGECKAQLLLQDLAKADEARLKKDAALKRERRAKFDLGWKVQRVPRNASHAAKLGCSALPQGLCALAFGADKTVSVVPTANPAASVNLEYLSVALKCLIQDGRQPLFSLDPKVDSSSNLHKLWHVKRFEPAWIDGTSAGEVMFQSDYHLKELSMGEYAQPVVGMRNALDYSAEQGLEEEWFAREWYVVNKAEIQMAKNSVLLARVEMAVEARETTRGEKGLEDVPITRPDHPLVQYADDFTHNLDLIAERKSVVYHLRELLKATVLAKFLVENRADLGEEWQTLAPSTGSSAHPEIPQLWNEQRASQIQVEDGRIVSSGEGLKSAGKMHGIYGGVETGIGQLQRVGVPVGRVPTAKVSMARAPALSQRLIQARTGMAEMPLEAPGAAPGVPKGVDLNLDRFDLSQAAETEDEVPAGNWGGEAFIGRAFWKNLSGSEVFGKEDTAMLRELFNPNMCDRREDCELFVPPETNMAYVAKLRSLLKEEATVREQRKEHFFSQNFAPDSASTLFPSWKPTVSVAGSQAGQLVAHPELVADAGRRLTARAASFDKLTEDGSRFRIYQLGGLEVRTIQEQGSEEAVGAVFSKVRVEKASEQGSWSTVAKTDKIVKAVLYVEQDVEAAEATAQHFFALLETDHDGAVAVEMLRDGSFAWVESPADLEARKAQAKVIRAAECSMGYTVQELRSRVTEAEAAARGDRRCYAEAVLLLVLSAREKAWAALSEHEQSLAQKLGASAEGWNTRQADVFGQDWPRLAAEQRSAAEALGFCEVSWCPSAARERSVAKTAPAPAQKKVEDLSKEEQEAIMAEWVKKTYGVGA